MEKDNILNATNDVNNTNNETKNTINNALVVFEGKQIRRTWFNDEWWFSVVDVVGALTDSSIPRRYWSDLKIQLNEQGFQLYEKIVQLKLPATDGKYYETDCANTEILFRLIQSIPSKKAEPFKQWLAQVGYDRVKEIENPELAQKRMKELYRLKGYSDNCNVGHKYIFKLLCPTNIVSDMIV